MWNIEMMNKYEQIFENIPISVWEEDWSELRNKLDALRKDIAISEIRTYLDANPAFLRSLAKSIKVLRVNKRTVELYEAENEKSFYPDLTGTFCDESYNIFKEEIIAIYRGETEFEMEAKTKTFKGKTIYTVIHVKLPSEHDDYNNVLLTMRDITYSKTAYREYFETKAKFNRSFYQGIVGMAITDLSGNILDVNPSFCEILQYSKEELICMNCKELEINNEGNCFEKMACLLREEKEIIKEEKQLRRKDGTHVWVLDGMSLLKNEEGVPQYFVGQIIDINQQKNSALLLQENVNKYRHLLDSTNTMYLLLNREGEITDYSETFLDLMGINKECCKEKSLRSMIVAESMALYDETWKKIMQGEMVNNVEIALIKNEILKWVSLNGSMMKNGAERVFLLMTDINHKKQEEFTKLIEKEKHRDRLRNNIKELRQQIEKMKG